MMSETWKKILRLVAGVILGCVLMTTLRAAETDGNPRDTLVYKDGDRVQGKVIKRTDDEIVFKSDRFGELRVPAKDAVVILAEKPAGTAATAQAATTPGAKGEAKAAGREEEEKLSVWEWFSPGVLTAKVRDYFGPWHGRFAFLTEVVTDSAQRDNMAFDAHMQRKWKSDDVQINGHYDFSKINGLTTTDVVKMDGLWRHDFIDGRFALYRPSAEWNRANVLNGVPSEYLLLQQEIGAGLSLVSTPSHKVRAGLSENLFNVWNSGVAPARNSRAVVSTFEEVELKLPWRMALTQRAVLYNPFRSGRIGWEDTVELNKKLTETLSVSIRHEIRRNNPDGSSQDYTRLKLLLGFDF